MSPLKGAVALGALLLMGAASPRGARLHRFLFRA